MTEHRRHPRTGLAVALLTAVLIAVPVAWLVSGDNQAVAAPVNLAPTADLVLNPATVAVGASVTADGSGSTDDVGVTSWTYNWGDGSKDRREPESTLTHIYKKAGSYKITLTVRDQKGKKSSVTKPITVTKTASPGNAKPDAVVTAKKLDGSTSAAVIDGGASKDDKGIESYTYDFGDGSSTEPQPASTVRHDYDESGTYTIKLTATDTAGQTDTSVTTFAATSKTSSPIQHATTVSFTFDDTFSSQLSAAAVLHQHGMNGTFYVNSPRLTGGDSTYMTKAQVDGLQAAGDEIGGHTLTHVDLAEATTAEATRQICDDRTALVKDGYPGKSFAYPFGSTSATVDGIVKSCGYTNARVVGNLRSPGYGCFKCDTAETIPSADTYEISTNQSVQSDTTLDMLKAYVTQAEEDQGGWVPLVIHSICDGCVDTSISIDTFTQFVSWLSQQPNVSVKTVGQVEGGTSSPTEPPSSDPTSVSINGKSADITGTNVARGTNALIYYTPAFGASTKTNAFGTEVAVVNGKVTQVATSVGSMAIPSNGYVLSGHGTANTWLKTNAKVGATVTLNGGAPPSSAPPTSAPPTSAPPTSAPPTGKVTIGSKSLAITGTNARRTTDALIVYTPAFGATTGTNEFGFEAVVVNGKVTMIQDVVGNIAIPNNGYVLSGHGTARTWLKTNAKVGASVS